MKIETTYCPGFSPDLTSWEIRISSTGQLRQRVQIADFESGENEEFEQKGKVDLELAKSYAYRIIDLASKAEKLNPPLSTIDDFPLLRLRASTDASVSTIEIPDIESSYFQAHPLSKEIQEAGRTLFLEIMELAPWQDPRLQPGSTKQTT